MRVRLLRVFGPFVQKITSRVWVWVWCDNPTSMTLRGEVDGKEKIRGKAAKFGPKMIVSKRAI